LIGILLPALSRARDQSNTVACSSNLREIGQGLTQYLADYNGVFPPSNYYKGLGWDPMLGQIPTEPTQGYVHWSSFLYARQGNITNDTPFYSPDGWRAFQCPAIANGGLPPANTYPANSDGLPNEVPGVVDWQAPRCAYTVNEALCPRGIFELEFDSRQNVRIYKFFPASRIRDSSETILATEIWGGQNAVTTTSLIDGTTIVSASRRPVNGINPLSGCPADSPYKLPYTKQFLWATPANLTHDPSVTIQPGATVTSTLDWVGRNHGLKKSGSVAGGTGTDWDMRKTNFLFVDGHVETKHIAETVYPKNEWGGDFYTLDK
jgi:prepilin-type processing-associated H-X9-DG protein